MEYCKTHENDTQVSTIRQLHNITSFGKTNAAQFRYVPGCPIENIVSVRLLHAILPNSSYTITKENQSFCLNAHHINVPIGYYPDVEDLIVAIQALLPPAYLIEYDTHTRLVSIASDAADGTPFSVYFPDQSTLCGILGFCPMETMSAPSDDGRQVIPGVRPSSTLLYMSSPVHIRVRQMSRLLPDDGLLEIILRETHDSITYFSKPASDPSLHFRSCQCIKLKHLDFDLTDAHGNLIQFNGITVRLILEFETLCTPTCEASLVL